MPIGIVTETCPAPECNLTEQDVEQFMAEMTEYTKLFAPAFRRVEQMEWSQAYLRGLLGDASRKNIEQIALGMGEKVRSMQYFIGQSPWKTEPVIRIQGGLAAWIVAVAWVSAGGSGACVEMAGYSVSATFAVGLTCVVVVHAASSIPATPRWMREYLRCFTEGSPYSQKEVRSPAGSVVRDS